MQAQADAKDPQRASRCFQRQPFADDADPRPPVLVIANVAATRIMATGNGTATPPAPVAPTPTAANPDTSDHKRKREDESGTRPATGDPVASAKSRQTQRDVREILQQYDTKPSFLEYEFDDSSSSEPSQKKARLSEGASRTTIAGKLGNGAYTSLASLKEDAARVTKTLEESLRAKAGEVEGPNAGRLTVEELKQIQHAKAFERLVADVVTKESEYERAHDGQPVKKEAGGKTNAPMPDSRHGADGKIGTVLTLFGNAPTPKQLFSSMQSVPEDQQQSVVKSELPVEEMSLPNGLTATNIMPVASGGTKKGPTFEEAFAPPYSLPVLHPPKAHKRSSTRDSKITWEFKDAVNRSSKKGGYTVQSLPKGDWLGYGGDDAARETSPKEKRKQRERALSNPAEGNKDASSNGSPEEQQAREEAALFRRAYSSFAPSVDNAKALIPAETKSAIWWDKVGERRFNEVFAIDPALVDESAADTMEALPETQLTTTEPEDFARTIRELDELDQDMLDAHPDTSKTKVDQVLREAADLLETLASHQRIRNASLPAGAASRTSLSPAPALASRIGKPDEPAEAEVSTYHALRRELAYLILKLPPYAVAKMDGDQLAELGVSKLVPFERNDYKGTMEEDQVARLAKYNAMATAAGIATLTRGNSASGQHYNQTAQRTPAIGQAANTRYGQTAQYGAARTPATQPQYQRTTSSQSFNTPTATAPRPTYSQQPAQYTRPGASQQSYTQAPNGQSSQYYQQRPAQTPGGYSTTYASNSQPSYTQTPQTQAPPRPTYSSSQPLAQFQARSHAAAANAVAYQTNAASQGSPFPRTASPATGHAQAPQQHHQQQQPPVNVQPRPPNPYQAAPQPQQQQYGQQPPGSGRATPNFSPSGAQTPVNGFPAARPPPPMPPQTTTTQGLAPRAASGTPQPIGVQYAAPPPRQQQGQQQVQTNGHA